MQYFEKKLKLNVPVACLFDWHKRPGAFQRLLPPWEVAECIEQKGTIQDGDWLKLRMGLLIWLARHQGYIKNKQFTDLQVQGPFAYWRHQHFFYDLGSGCSELRDYIEYGLPFGVENRLVSFYIQQKLERMFAYRHRVTLSDIHTHYHYLKGNNTMKILITGSSGMVGKQLSAFLSTGGHDVYHMVRHDATNPNQIFWRPSEGLIDAEALEDMDAVIHLAGESIAGGLWTAKKKSRILESRIIGTRLLTKTLYGLKKPPKVLISASAIGYYGDSGQKQIIEEDLPGNGFLAEVCQAWESELDLLNGTSVRVIKARLGIVLSPAGGALARMLPAFKLGLGGRLGSGEQYMSWIAMDDLVRAFYHCLFTEELKGAVNFTAPYSVSNLVFTKTLASVLHRPDLFGVPTFALRLGLGEMAEEMLLASARVYPDKLLKTAFQFNYPDLKGALGHLLGG